MENTKPKTPSWKLLKGDTLIGILHDCKQDWPWFGCDFEPTSEFEDYADIFAREARFLHAGEEKLQDRVEAMKQIQEQNFILELDDKSVILTKFRLHIRGNEASFRPRRSGTQYKKPVEPDK